MDHIDRGLTQKGKFHQDISPHFSRPREKCALVIVLGEKTFSPSRPKAVSTSSSA
jgi:hypothetical protein